MICSGETAMPLLRPRTDDPAGEAPRQAAPGSRASWLRRAGRSTVMLLVAGLSMLALGFVWFLGRVPPDEVALDRNADGIVALTGGASRVADAIELLANGHGKRLLISGLNRTTTVGEISRL